MTQSYNQITGTYDFGSIVRALQAQIAAAGEIPQEYPYNFQGITQAIQDLTFVQTQNPGADIGPSPSMGDVTIDENGDPQFAYSTTPLNGDLWFDTRQGRMFIAYDSQWYQTNGGDGLTIITTSNTPPVATNLAIGQQWYNRDGGILYVFAGTYSDGGQVVTTPTATSVPIWQQLVDISDQQTTATLPLAGPTIDAKILEAVSSSNFLPTNFDPDLITHQDDVNLYYIDALLALDDVIKLNQPTVDIDPPNNPVVGQFWFDSSNIEMSIWYSAPGDAWGQWVPVFSPAKIDDNLTTLKASQVEETAKRVLGDANLQTNINTVDALLETHRGTLQNGIDGLQAQINAIPASPDMSLYITAAQEQVHYTDLQNQMSGLTADVGNIYTKYAKLDFVNEKVDGLQTEINACATSAQLTAVQNTIPSLTGYATTAYVDSQVGSGLTAAGGTITGNFVFDRADVGIPGLDFSGQYYDGTLAQKYRTNCQMTTPHYATFGTNENMYEYAWDFDDNEDFCWTHGTNGKVASIDKTGIAATNYYIATFGTNDSSGRNLTSTIDVGARLQTTKVALENLRTNAATATTLDELKTAIANALANV